MQHLVRAVRDALAAENWYAALALALTLPDTCASFEDPGRGRYARWADRFVAPHFRAENGVVFLTGRELYLLRCAFLHESDFSPQDDSPQSPDDSAAMFEVLNCVQLYASRMSVVAARGMTKVPAANPPTRSTSYSTSVVELCDAICRAVASWSQGVAPEIEEKIAAMPRILWIHINGKQTPI